MAASIPTAPPPAHTFAPVVVHPGAGWRGPRDPKAVLGPLLRVGGAFARGPLSPTRAGRYGPVANQAASVEAQGVLEVLGSQHFLLKRDTCPAGAPADAVELQELRDAHPLLVWIELADDTVAVAWREAWSGSVGEGGRPPIPRGYHVRRVYLAWPLRELPPRSSAELARLKFSSSVSLTSSIDCFMPVEASVAWTRGHTPSEVTIEGRAYFYAAIDVQVSTLPKPCRCNCSHIRVPHRGATYSVYSRRLSFGLQCASTCSGGDRRSLPHEPSIDELLAAIEGGPAAAASDGGRMRQAGGATTVAPRAASPPAVAAATTAAAPPPASALDARLAAATGAIALRRARLARLRAAHAAELAELLAAPPPPPQTAAAAAAVAAAAAAPAAATAVTAVAADAAAVTAAAADAACLSTPDPTLPQKLLALEAALVRVDMQLAAARVASDATRYAAMMEGFVADALAPLDAMLAQATTRARELEAAAAPSREAAAEARTRAAAACARCARNLGVMLASRQAARAALQARLAALASS